MIGEIAKRIEHLGKRQMCADVLGSNTHSPNLHDPPDGGSRSLDNWLAIEDRVIARDVKMVCDSRHLMLIISSVSAVTRTVFLLFCEAAHHRRSRPLPNLPGYNFIS